MRKKILLFGALVGTFMLASCGGGSSKKPVYSAADVEAASQVIQYYGTSLEVLKNVDKGKDINAVLGYMEQRGKAPQIPGIAPPLISEKDTVELMNPGTYFNEETQANLKLNYAGLFRTRDQFYATFDKYLAYVKANKQAEANKLLEVNYQLSTEMTEYKQNIFDILSPFVANAESIILADNPLKEQLTSVRKIDATMRSIINLYTRKHVADGLRLDVKTTELGNEIAAAKKLPEVSGHEGEMKSFRAYLAEAEAFLNKVQKARGTGQFFDADYEMLTSAYEASMI